MNEFYNRVDTLAPAIECLHYCVASDLFHGHSLD